MHKMLNLNKCKKTKPKPKPTLIFTNCSYVCACHCAQLPYTTAQTSSDNFPAHPPDNHHSSDDVYWRGKVNGQKQQQQVEAAVSPVRHLVVSSVTLDTVTGTCQPMNLPSRASDTSTSSGSSGIHTRNWMNRACRPYLTMTEADDDPRDSDPSRNTNPHDSDTSTTDTCNVVVDCTFNNNNNNLICIAPECQRLQRRWRTESTKKN